MTSFVCCTCAGSLIFTGTDFQVPRQNVGDGYTFLSAVVSENKRRDYNICQHCRSNRSGRCRLAFCGKCIVLFRIAFQNDRCDIDRLSVSGIRIRKCAFRGDTQHIICGHSVNCCTVNIKCCVRCTVVHLIFCCNTRNSNLFFGNRIFNCRGKIIHRNRCGIRSCRNRRFIQCRFPFPVYDIRCFNTRNTACNGCRNIIAVFIYRAFRRNYRHAFRVRNTIFFIRAVSRYTGRCDCCAISSESEIMFMGLCFRFHQHVLFA